MSKRIETSIIINKPLDTVWQEVKVMENHVNWMEDAVKIDILSENNSGIDTKMNVLTKVCNSNIQTIYICNSLLLLTFRFLQLVLHL